MPRMGPQIPAEMVRLLGQVSRSFYLTLRILPAPVRSQISLAYLFARAADTIADTRLVPVERRLSALREMRGAIVNTATGRTASFPDLGSLVQAQTDATPGEREILGSIGRLLGALRRFSREDRQLICEVLHTITIGQETDLTRFGYARPGEIRAMETERDLEEYIYCVAGCVGEFWTRVCRAHLFPHAPLDEARMLADGVRFGKGLQLVNILRDLPRDLQQGRCYIPLVRLRESGLVPADLIDPGNMSRFRVLYDEYLGKARGHLSAGWSYTENIPRGQVRVRLACAWPILIGVKTLARLEEANVLDGTRRIRISRPEIRRLMFVSLVRYPAPRAWHRLFDRASPVKHDCQ